MKKNVMAYYSPSAHDIQELMVAIFGMLSDHFGGDATINQLRIGSYIGLKALFEDKYTYNRDISLTLGIPPSTVTRIVTELIAQGYVTEEDHPEDGRVRLISMMGDHPLSLNFESELRELVKKLIYDYQSQAKKSGQ
jgi:hypothetical protein